MTGAPAAPGPIGPRAVRRVYDAVAGDSAGRVAGELAHTPFTAPTSTASRPRRGAPAARSATWAVGPARSPATYASAARAFGADLSPEQLRRARRLRPGLPFVQLDMLRLPLAAGALAGAVACSSIIHVSLDQAEQAFRELARVPASGGRALLAFHAAGADAPRTRPPGAGAWRRSSATPFGPTPSSSGPPAWRRAWTPRAWRSSRWRRARPTRRSSTPAGASPSGPARAAPAPRARA